MGKLGTLLCAGVFALSQLLLSIAPAQAQAQTRLIPLANVQQTCLDVSHETVNVWMLSIVTAKQQGWFTEDNAVGISVSLTITGPSSKASFPSAQSVSVVSLPSGAVRVPVNLEILQGASLESDGQPDKNVSAALTILHTQGNTPAAAYIQGLISFTQNAATLLPATPFTSGMELAGQVANNILSSVKSMDASNVSAPDYPLSFSLSTDPSSGQCSDPNALESGLYVVAEDTTDYSGPNVIQIANAGNYCFYSAGVKGDPYVVFAPLPNNGTCSTSIPAQTNPLWNPQILFMAYGSPSGATAAAPATPAELSMATNSGRQISAAEFASVLASNRDGRLSAAKPSLNGKNKASVAIARATAICKASFIPLDQCLKK